MENADRKKQDIPSFTVELVAETAAGLCGATRAPPLKKMVWDCVTD